MFIYLYLFKKIISLKVFISLLDEKTEYDEFDQLPPINMAKKFYHSCMHEEAIEKASLWPLKFGLLDGIDGWPLIMLEKWNETKYTWQRLDTYYNNFYSLSSFFNLAYEDDPTNNIFTIDPSPKYPAIKFVDDAYIFKHMDLITKVVNALAAEIGVTIPEHILHENIAKLLFFENDLRKINEQETQQKKIRTTIENLQKYYDSASINQSTAKIDWLLTIQSVFGFLNISITASKPVIVYNPNILRQLAHLLNNISPSVIVNYIQWNIVSRFMMYLNKQIRDINIENYYSTFDVTPQEPRWIMCIASSRILGHAMSYLFVNRYISTDSLKAISDMLRDIKAEMKERISLVTWLNDTIKEAMINKIVDVSLYTYPKWYNDQTAFNTYFEGLDIGESYFQNVLAILKYENKKKRMNVFKPTDENEWKIKPINIGIHYFYSSNKIFIAPAIIQDPYFTSSIPLFINNFINYGAIGSLIGYELAYGISIGELFDENGVLIMDNETMDVYKKRLNCFEKQYKNFILNTTDKNRKPIQSNEKLAEIPTIKLTDYIGIQAVFEVFQKSKKAERYEEIQPETKLIGLPNFSNEQLFFLSYANVLCASKETSQMDHIGINLYNLAKFRTISFLSNTISFSEAFNCPVNSPMNPEEKCNF